MKAVYLVKFGDPEKTFEIREVPIPAPKAGEVLVKVEGFGLNFADTLARKGLYQEVKKSDLPATLGYDVCGIVASVGADVKTIKAGERITGLTRLTGYAEYAIVDERACIQIPATLNIAEATALATQYCTAYYCSSIAVNLFKGDKVLIQAAAGGVGIAFVQMCLHKGCEIFATAGSTEKLNMLKNMGVQHTINYREKNFAEYIHQYTNGKGVDVIFDSIGGTAFRKGIKSLAAGGRIVGIGAAELSSPNIFSQIKGALGFGFYHPAQFLLSAKSLIGINMLKIADDKPEKLKYCFEKVMELYHAGAIKPLPGKIFPLSQLAEAHYYLESRKSTGKIAISI